jgi:hypothetical protein
MNLITHYTTGVKTYLEKKLYKKMTVEKQGARSFQTEGI